MKRKTDLHLIGTFFRPTSIMSALKCLFICEQLLRLLFHYVTRNPLPSGPEAFRFRTPTGVIELWAFSAEDVITLFIFFCRNEYAPLKGARVLVDFDSNIGVTAAYFLSRSTEGFVYCYEPNGTNIERLKNNLRPFEGRYFLEEHPSIDFLKIDMEGLEQDVIKAITPEFLGNIGQIQAETGEFDHQIPGFRRTQSGAIVRYQRFPR